MDWSSGDRDQVRGGVHVEACDNNTVDGGANLLRSSFFWLVLREVLSSSHLCMDTLTESMAHNIFNGASSQLVLWRNHLTEDAGVYSEWRGLKLSKRENKLMITNVMCCYYVVWYCSSYIFDLKYQQSLIFDWITTFIFSRTF